MEVEILEMSRWTWVRREIHKGRRSSLVLDDVSMILYRKYLNGKLCTTKHDMPGAPLLTQEQYLVPTAAFGT